MKLWIERERFAALFSLAAMVAPPRSPREILTNIKIQALGNEAVITASDMDLAIRLHTTLVTVERPGVVVLPVGRFNGVLKEVTDEKLLIEVINDQAVITGVSSRFELPLVDPDEFPVVEDFSDKNYLEMPSRVLKEMIKRTAFAADVESTRYALSGILLEPQSDQLMTAVATDGRRLAKMDGVVRVVGEVNTQQTTIAPTKAMLLVEKMLPDDDSPLRLAVDSNELRVQTTSGTIHSRLVEGRFPKWKDALPQNRSSLKVDILAGTLYSALRQAAIVSDAETRGVDFWFSNGTLVVNSQAAQIGNARIEVPINYDGDEVKTALDLRFLTDMLRVVGQDQLIRMDIEGPQTAAYLTTNDSFGYVIMPLTRKTSKA
jgi:DNA polymerase-3 subunit beta